MALEATDWQQSILNEIGAALPDVKQAIDRVRPNIGKIWEMWAAKASQPYLQYLYARRTALDWIIGQFRNLTNANLGALNPRLGEKFEHLVSGLRVQFTDDIREWETMLRASRPGFMGALTQTAPVTVPVGEPDPNDMIYRGDATRRSAGSSTSNP